MSSADAGAGAGAGADDVLDARETLADGGKRLARALRGPFARAQPHWKSFAQLTFACPTASEVPGRMKKNLQQFGYCYVSLAAALAAYNALSRALLAVMLAGAFIGHHYVTRVRRAPIEIGGRVFGAKTQGVACAAATAIFFWKFITDVFFSAASVALAFAAAHALMRVPEPKTDEDEGEIPLLRDFAAAYRESGADDYVPPQVSSTVRGLFASVFARK